MSKSRTCGPLAEIGAKAMTFVVIATRGERLALSRTAPRAAISGPRRSTPTPRHRRDRRRQPDRGARRFRPRRRRRRLRGTRRPLSRGRSGRPRAHMVGHHAGLSPRSTATRFRRHAGLGQHRPPTTSQRFAAGDLVPYNPRRAGTARQTSVSRHRDRASAERPRGGRHQCRARDLARGLRRRVARDRGYTVEGDMISRSEVFDEIRPRRRTREVRRTQSLLRRGWRTRQAERTTASTRTSRPATGTPWRR